MKPEHYVMIYLITSIIFGIVLWWRRSPWSKNPVFPMIMMPLVIMVTIFEWLDGIRDKYSPHKEETLNEQEDFPDSGGF